MINVNYYGLNYQSIPTTRQASRVAGTMWAILKWRKDALIDNKVPSLKLQNVS